MDQIGRREPARQFRGRNSLEVEVAPVENVGVGDFAGRGADADLDRIVADQMLELLAKIVAEQGRAGDRSGVDAGLVEASEGAVRGRWRDFRVIFDPKFGIGKGTVVTLGGIGANALFGLVGERFAKAGNGGGVAGFQFVEDPLD